MKNVSAVLMVILSLFWSGVALGQRTSIEEYTRGMPKQEGYFPFYWDEGKGRLLLEVGVLGQEFLYLPSLATGVGSNRLFLDRANISQTRIALFRRVGPRLFLVLENPRFRAGGESQDLTRSVRESFPLSTVAGFDILAEDPGKVLIDFTTFLLQDVLGVDSRLRSAEAGNYRLESALSSLYLERCRAFPRNTELEVTLTFTSQEPGREVEEHAPDGRYLSLRVHHSLVKLPEPGYRPRRFDPRIGIFPVTFFDFSRSFDQDYRDRYIMRHRLKKKHPRAPLSEPEQPIIYYLDRAVPEPYRSAFREGAMWWDEVFQAAGFLNAFRVEDMPEEMDPLDARYHVIMWVHRTEAGSSIGPSFVDPRTGEIIKAAVRMDSHRSLVDYDIFASTVPAPQVEGFGQCGWMEGTGVELLAPWLATLGGEGQAEEFVMARRRQHAAHEVGHTLGLAHNFVAASYGRESVMDYPAPLIQLREGRLDLSEAYRDGPGDYDRIAIRYAYTPFPPEEEEAGLRAIAQEALERGLKFITNPDESSRSSYPEATTWINGSDPLEELERMRKVRRFLLEHFGEEAVEEGEPMALLNRRFAWVYLHHRFILAAVIKAVGGMEFRYALRGDGLPPTQVVDPARQRRALRLLMEALQVQELEIPERIIRLLAPRPFGYPRDERALGSGAGPAFDPLAAARTLAGMVLRGLLEPERTARVAAFHLRNPAHPSLEEVVETLVQAFWGPPVSSQPPLARVVQRVLVDELLVLASDREAAAESRAAAEWGLRLILERIQEQSGEDSAQLAHLNLVQGDIERFLNRSYTDFPPSAALPPPPGTPIGQRPQ